jgi:hypothetical protein
MRQGFLVGMALFSSYLYYYLLSPGNDAQPNRSWRAFPLALVAGLTAAAVHQHF